MENLVGQTFNRLTVIKWDHKKGHNFWLCLCACGNEVVVDQSKLKSGHTKSCGCLKKERLIDITGQQFGLWTVVSFSYFAKTGDKQRPYWNCKCACGNEGIVRGDILKDGGSKSCGCYEKDRSLIPLPAYSYEEAYKKVKSVYKHMKQRCLNLNKTRFKDYGGRGIKICDRWLESFDNFLEDMGVPPSLLHQLDRLDNDGDYCPENCRWTTTIKNNRNKRDNHTMTFEGKTQCLTSWAEDLLMNKSTLSKRKRMGWSDEKALSTPVNLAYSRSSVS